MKNSKAEFAEEIPPEVDFSGGVRGKYAGAYPTGSRVIVLDPDVAKVFTSQESANVALRGLAMTMKLVAVQPKPKVRYSAGKKVSAPSKEK